MHTATGLGTVQVPNDDLETILEVAERYGVTHIVLPVPRSALTLERVAEDPRFERAFGLQADRVSVFRIRSGRQP